MPNDIDAGHLTKITNDLIQAISSAPFVAAMKTLKATPPEQRLQIASSTLSPAALQAAGVQFPEGMRITSRYFEPGSPDIIEVTDDGAVLRNVNLLPQQAGVAGAWGCACGGAATVCGGAGGGS
jgi:hypothetical protein